MATVDKAFADALVAGDGWLVDTDQSAGDNPPAVRITEYNNAWGGKGYGVVFEGDRDLEKYNRETQYIGNPKIYWEKK